MRLLKNGEFLEDTWLRLRDDEAVPQGADVIVGIERLRREFGTLMLHYGRLAVALPNDRPVEDVVDYLEALDAVLLDFPAFTDGRAYSQARQLRSTHGYRGELRASGNVLPDQLAFMRQCGIDTFEVNGRFDRETWQRAATAMTLTYQRGYLPERGFAPADVWSEREGSSDDTLRSDFKEVRGA
ncbi:MAG: DUF934 domain-containing protein [Hyphomicrobiales bacterium]